MLLEFINRDLCSRKCGSKFFASIAIFGFMPGGVALAQENPYQYLTAIKPAISTLDENGVDMVSGKAHIEIPLLSFSKDLTALELKLDITQPGDVALSFSDIQRFGLPHNFDFAENAFYSESIGAVNAVSTPVGGGMTRGGYSWLMTNSDGSTYLPSIGPTNIIYLSNTARGEGYYTADGTRVHPLNSPGLRYPDRIQFPNGEVWRFYIQTAFDSAAQTLRMRPRSFSSSRGVTIEIQYRSDDVTQPAWGGVARVLSFNKAQVYCDESAMALCSNTTTALDYVDFVSSNSERSVMFRRKGQTQGRKITFAPGSPISADIQKVEDAGVPGSEVSYTYAAAGNDNDGYNIRHVSSVTKGGGTWDYTYWRTMEEGRITAYSMMYVYGPLGTSYSASGNLAFGAVEWITDTLGRTYGQGLDSYIRQDFRILSDSQPDGTVREYQRDWRNNITKLRFVPQTGSSDPAYEINATYPGECANPRTCNKPLTVTDARGAVTTYTYDQNHGGILAKTMPAVNGISPVTRYAYAQRYPWLKNASGGFSQATEPVWLLTEERVCRTTATVANGCAGGPADEVITSYDYGSDGTANNLMLRGTAVTADGQTLRTCYVHNYRGDIISQTSPRGTGGSCL
ncbi:YD repeat-containing protein [Sphingomonas leidyi]|uniref:YD repeat-containing protein n=1 Tax=Sphingomonas leidyi TaxID=68569 RepID=A0A7X5ZVD6_9SPHN|nr:hypothetical protein [Sphingomonas leidyi]NIJ64634.1 YD repeat-containing protein [Sphingomonas leidyi]